MLMYKAVRLAIEVIGDEMGVLGYRKDCSGFKLQSSIDCSIRVIKFCASTTSFPPQAAFEHPPQKSNQIHKKQRPNHSPSLSHSLHISGTTEIPVTDGN